VEGDTKRERVDRRRRPERLFWSVDHEKLLTLVAQQVAAMLKREATVRATLSKLSAGLRKVEWLANLANIFLHYAFDLWMVRTHPDLRGVGMRTMGWSTGHNEQEAQLSRLSFKLAWRSAPEMHPTKTKIVYCQRYEAQRRVSKCQI